jgi:hypothetical protein
MEPVEEKENEPAPDAITDMNGLWLVCFTGRADHVYWWDRFRLTTKDFRHCYLLQYQVDTERWILIDWRTGLCDVVVFEHDELKYIFGHLEQSHGTAVMVKGRIPEREIHYRVPLIYCVQAVLQVLGWPTRWTFTPYQLYKRLIRSGCEELINHRSQSDGWRQQTKSRSDYNETKPTHACQD